MTSPVVVQLAVAIDRSSGEVWLANTDLHLEYDQMAERMILADASEAFGQASGFQCRTEAIASRSGGRPSIQSGQMLVGQPAFTYCP